MTTETTGLIPLLGVAATIVGLMLGMFYWSDRRNERRIDRLEVRQNQQLKELEARQDQQSKETEVRQNQQLKELEARQNQRFKELEARQNQRFKELEARQNQRFDEMAQSFKDVDLRLRNVEQGQSRVEGYLELLRDAVFRRSPSQG